MMLFLLFHDAVRNLPTDYKNYLCTISCIICQDTYGHIRREFLLTKLSSLDLIFMVHYKNGLMLRKWNYFTLLSTKIITSLTPFSPRRNRISNSNKIGKVGRHLLLIALRTDRRQADCGNIGGKEPQENGRWRIVR